MPLPFLPASNSTAKPPVLPEALSFRLSRQRSQLGHASPACLRVALLLAFLLLALVSLALPAFATTPVTVEQLEQALAASKAWPDKEAALRLTTMELTERLSKARYEHLKTAVPGEKTQLALLALADASAFLNLPAADTLKLPAPDQAAQGRIVSKAADFVMATIPKMPDFYASRTITRFQDLKVSYGMDEPVVVANEGFHFVDRVGATVTYRNGREVVEPPAGKKPGSSVTSSTGLINWGVFGPLLGLVMTDVMKGKIGWGHWEQGPTGPMAVFRYAVAEDRSTYTIRYCCFRAETGEMRQFEAAPAYHGELAIDPATGAIYRLVLKTDLQPELPMEKIDVVVDYGPVEIGGKTYVCPVESTSISRAEAQIFHGNWFYVDRKGKPDTAGLKKKHTETVSQPIVTAINDVVFENYHQFRAEMRILPEESAEPDSNAPAPVAPPPAKPPPMQ